jgi:1-acyl-sn-glycerol-3-phosphate acyltransferase
MAAEVERDSVLDRWGRDIATSHIPAFFEAAYRSWFRVEWEGIEHIPKQGGALIVSNHAGLMPVDGGLIQYGIQQETSRLVYLLAHHGFYRFPFIGRTLRRFGAVVAHPDNAHRLLQEDEQLVVVFPEGEKGPVKPPSERYKLQRFGRGGFVETAMRAGVPIVPIVLMGTEDTTPTLVVFEPIRGQRVPLTLNTVLLGPLIGPFAPLPAKIRARVLPPVHFDEPPGQAAYPRSLLMDRAESIRTGMQGALDDLYASRRSTWYG